MIFGISHPQAPWIPPSTFIVSFWDWDPCLGLEVLWPCLRSSSQYPPDSGIAYSYAPIPHNNNTGKVSVQA